MGWLRQSDDGNAIAIGGDWDIANANNLDVQLAEVAALPGNSISFDLSDLKKLDTVGAWLLYRAAEQARAAGKSVQFRGARTEHDAILRRITDSYRPCQVERPYKSALARLVERVGRESVAACEITGDFIAFLGASILAAARVLRRPGRFRLTSFVFHMEKVGLNAIPIVVLLAFLIGIVLAYQGAQQLRQFGAQIFVVDMVAISVLRELGVLMTAIIIAGRSASTFAAQIGSMKVNEEIDALRTIGVNPIEAIVLPRVLALLFTLPLLAFLANGMALMGGALMSWVVLDVGTALYLDRLRDAVTVTTLLVGLVKAPVFAVLIGLVGCYEGLQVSGSAQSVGEHTTRAVVEAIFLVIIADALFSILFSMLGI